jgi:hypothetical protein
MDNPATHNRPEHLQLMASLLAHLGWLPLHSTHCLQSLELTLFGVYKRTYQGARAQAAKPKLEGKLMRALYSCHVTKYAGAIFNAWKAAWVVMLTIKDQPFNLAVSMSEARTILCENCHDGETACATL